MSSRITRIRLRYLFSVNCYLVEAAEGYVLVDTGVSRRRSVLRDELERADCRPGGLALVVLTHAHSDHAGNCAYLRREFGARVAMHAGDAGKVRRGDMFFREVGGRDLGIAAAKLASSVVGMGKFEAFEPDVLLGDGQALFEYGLDAVVHHLPGHSPGSIGVLTAEGDFFCGDLLTNRKRPERNSLVDDAGDMDASIQKLGALSMRKVYPGHGAPFAIESLGSA